MKTFLMNLRSGPHVDRTMPLEIGCEIKYIFVIEYQSSNYLTRIVGLGCALSTDNVIDRNF